MACRLDGGRCRISRANIIADLQARKIDRLACDLEARVVPSINHLTTARGDLQSVRFAARQLVRNAATGKQPDRRTFEEALHRLDADMALYAELPPYPREAAMRHAAAKELGVHEQIVETLTRQLIAGNVTDVRALLDDKLAPASDRVDDRLQQLVELNAQPDLH